MADHQDDHDSRSRFKLGDSGRVVGHVHCPNPSSSLRSATLKTKAPCTHCPPPTISTESLSLLLSVHCLPGHHREEGGIVGARERTGLAVREIGAPQAPHLSKDGENVCACWKVIQHPISVSCTVLSPTKFCWSRPGRSVVRLQPRAKAGSAFLLHPGAQHAGGTTMSPSCEPELRNQHSGTCSFFQCPGLGEVMCTCPEDGHPACPSAPTQYFLRPLSPCPLLCLGL